jgi:hypothetical protein
MKVTSLSCHWTATSVDTDGSEHIGEEDIQRILSQHEPRITYHVSRITYHVSGKQEEYYGGQR